MPVTYAVITNRELSPQEQINYGTNIPELQHLRRPENNENPQAYASHVVPPVPGNPYKINLISVNTDNHCDLFYMVVDVGQSSDEMLMGSNVVSHTYFKPILKMLCRDDENNMDNVFHVGEVSRGSTEVKVKKLFMITLVNVTEHWRGWLMDKARETFVKGV